MNDLTGFHNEIIMRYHEICDAIDKCRVEGDISTLEELVRLMVTYRFMLYKLTEFKIKKDNANVK